MKSFVLIGPEGAARDFFAGRAGEGERDREWEREETEEAEENCFEGWRVVGREKVPPAKCRGGVSMLAMVISAVDSTGGGVCGGECEKDGGKI